MGWLKRLSSTWRKQTKQIAEETESKSVTFIIDSQGAWYRSPNLVGADLQTIYEAAAKSYACVSANSSAAASLPWVIQRWTENEWSIDRTHEANKLLRNPMMVGAEVRPKLSWQQLLELTCQHLQLDGNGYWHAPRGSNNRPLKFDPLLADAMTTRTDQRTGQVLKYLYHGNELDPINVIHFWATNPSSLTDGQSPAETASNAISSESTAQQRIDADLTNQIRPGLVVTFEKGVKEAQITKFRTYIEENYAAITKTGAPLIIGGGVSVTKSEATSPDYEKVRNLAKSDIVAVFGTPPPVIGDMAAATLQNFDVATRIWWNNKLFPMLALIANTINTQIVDSVFAWSGKIRFWYDISGTEVGLTVLNAKIAAAQGLVNLGYPPNAAARKVGLDMESFPELDQPLQLLALAGRNQVDDTNQ